MKASMKFDTEPCAKAHAGVDRRVCPTLKRGDNRWSCGCATNSRLRCLAVLMVVLLGVAGCRGAVRKVLVIGDSMSGWIGERFGAYGHANHFEVATVCWDGSTLRKWGKAASINRLKSIIAQQKPDAIIVSLGLNELLEPNPEKSLSGAMQRLKRAFGDIPVIWIGPPYWPGKTKQGAANKLDTWLKNQMGPGHYYCSLGETIERQSKTNPHPTRKATIKWIDNVIDWMQRSGAVKLPSANRPTGQQMRRGKTFIYRTIRQSL